MPQLKSRVAWIVPLIAASGCISVSGKGTLFVEPSIDRSDVNISRVAVVPNRLPMTMQDAEAWRKFNWRLIKEEFETQKVEVIDYETSVKLFEKSGLPVEDTKSSRDKYADAAKEFGVDAIIVPYYATYIESVGGILLGNDFVSAATLQVYLAKQNDFFSRIDITGTYRYRTGGALITVIGGLSLGGAAVGVDQAAAVPSIGYLGYGLMALLPVAGVIFDIISSSGSARSHWERAFRVGIHEGLKPFFASVTFGTGG